MNTTSYSPACDFDAQLIIIIVTNICSLFVTILNTVSSYSHLKNEDKEYIHNVTYKHLDCCGLVYDSGSEKPL